MEDKSPHSHEQSLVVILGPTASGKSELALDLAKRFGAEIVSADSLQVYKYLNIGAAKPSVEERSEIPHHLIDIIEPDEEFNAGLFKSMAESAIDEIDAKSKRIILVGGAFLYVRVLLNGIVEGIPADRELRRAIRAERAYLGVEGLHARLRIFDPKSADKIHPNDYVRTERALEAYYLTGAPMSKLQTHDDPLEDSFRCLMLASAMERDEIKSRIELRTDTMFEEGLVQEVESILGMGFGGELKPLQSIGYKEIISCLDGEIDLERASELIKRDTKRLAKRQMTWLRREKDLNWLHPKRDYEEILKTVDEFLEGFGKGDAGKK